jgi:hypothetical protein
MATHAGYHHADQQCLATNVSAKLLKWGEATQKFHPKLGRALEGFWKEIDRLTALALEIIANISCNTAVACAVVILVFLSSHDEALFVAHHPEASIIAYFNVDTQTTIFLWHAVRKNQNKTRSDPETLSADSKAPSFFDWIASFWNTSSGSDYAKLKTD